MILDALYCHTFTKPRNSKTVVLDIEVRFNGEIEGTKKCDMALLNTVANELMFVEGKIFFRRKNKYKDRRIAKGNRTGKYIYKCNIKPAQTNLNTI